LLGDDKKNYDLSMQPGEAEDNGKVKTVKHTEVAAKLWKSTS
jgi:hypothetical protein